MPDQTAFLNSQPYELIPLNLAGAFTSPPPPDGFDPETARPGELARYGIHWSRPRDDQPKLLAAWRAVFGGKWKAGDWIVPRLTVQPARKHPLPGPLFPTGQTNATSPNWSGAVITNRGGAPLPRSGTGLDGYLTPWDNRQQVVYLGNDGDIHLLFWDGQQWNSSDLTQLAGAPPPIAGSSLVGYVTAYNQQQHVNFVGSDDHVHELVGAGGRWNHGDLTQAAGAPAAAAGSRLVGYETAYNSQHHVFFIDSNIHIHELLYGNGRWTHGDHTQNTPGAEIPAWPLNGLAGYVTTFNNQQHLIYLGRSGHVHELVWSGSGWVDNDLTQLTNSIPMSTAGGLDGYVTSPNRQQHINYVGTDSHVHELWYDGQHWNHNDLTNASGGAPLAALHSGVDGYETAFNGQQHVNYLGVDGDVHELWFQSQWGRNDLTVISYAAPWLSALGTWNIPTVTVPPEPPGISGGWNSSSWVGIDGAAATSNDVLQAGVEQVINADPFSPNFSPFYVAWFEWFAPAQGIFGSGSPGYINQVDIDNFPVSPGQQVYCAVQYVNNGTAGNLVFINRTTGQKFSITLAPPPGASFSGSSVEWIMEAPNGGEPATSLPAFSPIVFTPAYAFDFDHQGYAPSSGVAVNLFRGTQALTSVAISGEQVTIKFTG